MQGVIQQHTLSRSEARRVYNALGAGLDRTAPFEALARASALAQLHLSAGQRVLHVGVGTGREHALLAAAVAPRGVVIGIDLARTMLRLTREQATTPLVEGDAATLPFAAQPFDRLFAAYVLDLLPAPDLPRVLTEFRRVLAPDGRLVLVTLTHGVTPLSRAFVALWRAVYRVRPLVLGGCRPIHLAPLVTTAGFIIEQRMVIVQRGFPSEVVVATVP